MKIKLLLSGILITVQLLTSCSKDDSPDVILDETTITVTDFSKIIDENQDLNTVIGNISATSSDGDLTYSITNQSPTGAINIDSATGELTVADTNSFDFETNLSITATVNITGNSITETSDIAITLNDIDDLEYFLSDSKEAYKLADDGDWIEITETEYSNLAIELNEVSKIATEDSDYLTDDSEIVSNGPTFTLANANGINIPAKSYVFAFRFYSKSDNHKGNKVKVSEESVSKGYSDLGGILPTVDKGDHFFILKGNNIETEKIGYLAYLFNGDVGYNSNSKTIAYSNGDDSDLSSTSGNNSTFLYQGLSTTQKQW